jgi:hypothetical protein
MARSMVAGRGGPVRLLSARFREIERDWHGRHSKNPRKQAHLEYWQRAARATACRSKRQRRGDYFVKISLLLRVMRKK